MSDLMRVFLTDLAGGFSLEEIATKAELAGLGKISDVMLIQSYRQRKCGSTSLTRLKIDPWS
ncbi:MAG: hypothetical protein HQL83_05745 [Magnetococcales bacterium]|nr:hypothetical protein [Magnetococcales bacterium]MBF0347602.1 hypothetical protein [Magnetococcales bacterium]MBF0630109.1 hypothetical protein [Magnetococcales bacterium]